MPDGRTAYSIAYVDDEPLLLDLGKLFLEKTGQFRVDLIPSARAALSLLKTRGYDAIISDYQMPEMDGIEFLKQVRASGNTIPFILFTGRGREEVVIQALNAGADFYLQKGGEPVSQFTELAHQLRQAIQQRRAEISIRDLERREADIINFLPDAIFAVDRAGRVIAWNHAIETMTGVTAAEMLGKDNYAYAVPFYGKREPVLIDLIFRSGTSLPEKYARVIRTKDMLIADTSLPSLNGRPVTLTAKASPLYDRSGEIVGAIESIRDVTDRKTAEDELRRKSDELGAANEQLAASEKELHVKYRELAYQEQLMRENEFRLRYLLGFYERAADARKTDLLTYAVEGAGAITGSPLGYLAFLNADETELSMYAWSKDAMAECSMQEKPIVYKTASTGLWGEAVRQRRPVVTNDYEAPNPAKKGYPRGHPRITRHMNVPVFDDGRIVLVAGVANKPEDYTENDVNQLLLLMQGLWMILKRKRLQEDQRAAAEELAAAGEELKAQYDALAKSEVMIRESENRYRTLVEISPDAVIVISRGKIAYANPECLRLVNAKQAGDLIGRKVLSFIHPDDWNDARDDLKGMMEQGRTIPLRERRILTLDGIAFTCEFTAKPVMYQDIPSILAVFRDISDRRRAEDAMKLAGKKLVTMNDFTRHDILNTVTRILGCIDMAEDVPDKDRRDSLLRQIRKDVGAIVHQITFTREFEEIGIHSPVWQDVRETLRPIVAGFSRPGVVFDLDLDALEIYADPLFAKVFSNFIDNALRYGGKGMTRFRISAGVSGGVMTLVCEDNGTGIPEGQKEQIFERHIGGNAGMGLFLSREILAITGMAIKETGKPGTGARFEITVPEGVWSFSRTPMG